MDVMLVKGSPGREDEAESSNVDDGDEVEGGRGQE